MSGSNLAQEKNIVKQFNVLQCFHLGISCVFLLASVRMNSRSGELDLEELLNAPDELKDELGRFVDTEDMKQLFELIDADGGHEDRFMMSV